MRDIDPALPYAPADDSLAPCLPLRDGDEIPEGMLAVGMPVWVIGVFREPAIIKARHCDWPDRHRLDDPVEVKFLGIPFSGMREAAQLRFREVSR